MGRHLPSGIGRHGDLVMVPKLPRNDCRLIRSVKKCFIWGLFSSQICWLLKAIGYISVMATLSVMVTLSVKYICIAATSLINVAFMSQKTSDIGKCYSS